MTKNTRVAGDKSHIVSIIPAACSDEAKAAEFLEQTRWGNDVFCPHCGVVGESRKMMGRDGQRSARFLWMCNACRKQFSVRVGTVMEDSRIPLRHWCYAFWAACASKKGVSALQIKRMTGLSYKSALFLMARIRYAMSDSPGTTRPLSGTVEADETYIGGKPRNRKSQRVRQFGKRAEKACVVGMVERGGEIRPVHVAHEDGPSVRGALINHVGRDARLMTDESYLYRTVGKLYAGHITVKHSIGEYVRGEAYTNTIEGFFSLLKRGVYGTFHSVSKKHLHRYLGEFQYRYNTRKLDDGARTLGAIRKAEGKRLTGTDSRS